MMTDWNIYNVFHEDGSEKSQHKHMTEMEPSEFGWKSVRQILIF